RLSGRAAAARCGRALEPGHRARPETERAGRQDPRASGAVVPAETAGSVRGGTGGHPHLLRAETGAAHHERGPPERRIPVDTPDARGRKRRRDPHHASHRRFNPAHYLLSQLTSGGFLCPCDAHPALFLFTVYGPTAHVSANLSRLFRTKVLK